ncbi:MAG: helix-turn-helix domain-containing protein [Verrucomicrobiota bacterium]
MASPQTIPVLERVADLLAAVAESDEGLTAKELVLQLNIPQATCYRILRTLVKCGWLREGGNGLYRPAYELVRLARRWTALENRLAQIKPKLEALAEMTGLSAKISILEAGEAVIALRSKTQRPNSIVSPVGSRIPLAEAGSSGVMLLAVLPAEERKQALKKLKPSVRKKLLKAAADAQRQRLARAYGTDHPSIYAVSIALPAEVPVALSLVGWPEDFVGIARKKIERTLKAFRPSFNLIEGDRPLGRHINYQIG